MGIGRRDFMAGLSAAAAVGPAVRADAASGLEPRFDEIAVGMERDVAAGRLIGAAVAVTQWGRPVWSRAFGHADARTGRPVTLDTPFSLASLTKAFTAALVMTLVQAGRMSLDDPVEDHLPFRLPPSRFPAHEVTLRRLGAHAGGLPTLFQMVPAGGRGPTPERLVHDYGTAVYPAGRLYEYSNIGYALLGAAASHATGVPFSELIAARLLRPMGLSATFFDTDTSRLGSAAKRYGPDGAELPFYTTTTPPSGELYASVRDLTIFAAHVLGHAPGAATPMLSGPALAQMFSPVFHGADDRFTAFGWAGYHVGSDLVLVKGGGQPGARTELTMLPGRGVAIAVVANTSADAVMDRVQGQIADLFVHPWARQDESLVSPLLVPAASNRLHGEWSGTISNAGLERDVACRLAGDRAMVAVNGSPGRLVTELSYRNDTVSFAAPVPADWPPTDRISPQADRKLLFRLVATPSGLEGRCLVFSSDAASTDFTPFVMRMRREEGAHTAAG